MIRDITTVMRGTLIAQAVGFTALPLLSRMFTPDAFGHYQLFISLLTLLLVFPTLRYEYALLRARSSRELRAVAQLCFVLSAAVAAATGLMLALLDLFGWPPQIRDAPFPIWLLAAALLFGGVAQFLTILSTREKAFAAISNSKILQSSVYAGTSLGIGATSPVPSGLILADLAGRVGHAVWLAAWSRHRLPALWRPIGRASLWAVARRYREYPFVSVPGGVVNVLGGIITPIMIYATFNPAASGQYALLERSVNLPIALVVIAVGQVFTGQFSAELRRCPTAAAAHFRRVVGLMSLIALLPLISLLAAGPWLFAFFFGDEWQLAGDLSRLMAPAFASMLLSGPVHMVLTVMGFQKLQTSWEIGRLVLVLGLWLAVSRFDIGLTTTVATYSGVLVICNLSFVGLASLVVRRGSRGGRAALSTEVP